VQDYLRAQEKTDHLKSFPTVTDVPWRLLKPRDEADWFGTLDSDGYQAFAAVGSKAGKLAQSSRAESIFRIYTPGVKSNSDVYVYAFNREALINRASGMVEAFNTELDRWRRSGKPKALDSFLKVDEATLKWVRKTKRMLLRDEHLLFDERSIRTSLYRPYTKRAYFFERAFNEDVYRCPTLFPSAASEQDNQVICCTNHSQIEFGAQMTGCIPNECVGGRAGQCFPFYIYGEGGSRHENITDWALEQFLTHYGDPKIGKWDIFYYVYGILHHPGYRTKFADNLKRELPRIPFAPDFVAFAKAGKELAALHLDYEKLEEYPLNWLETEGVPLSYRVDDKMRLSKDKATLKVNPSLTLAGIPPETFNYRLGNRSALEWVIDQYQVSEDKRSGIRSDPNGADDPKYIVRLVGQVVRVSLETVRIVASLPERFAP
jgi:predicted helicase